MRHCIACGKMLPKRALFVLEQAPASAQNIPDEAEVKTDEGVTLGLYQCGECGLVQFDCTPVSYYKDVIRAGGFSTTMTELRRRQYRHLIETYHLEGKKFLEVGCGRGEFIKVLTEFPVQVYGMEHKAELVELAREAGLSVWREFPECADQIFSDEMAQGPFDVFLSFNFLEHQPRPDVMLQAIYRNLAEDGMGLVTVPALEYILEQGSYYELIRDHIAYYTFGTLRTLLEQNGFEVLEEEMLNRDTIAVIVKKIPGWSAEKENVHAGATGDRRTRIGAAADRKESGGAAGGGSAAGGSEYGDAAADNDAASGASETEMVQALVDGYERVTGEVRELIAELTAAGKSIAIWGASHQGFTLAATTGLRDAARYIIDSAPFKQGRFAPASHLRIVAPDHFFEEPVDAVLIVAPGYSDEIAGIIREKFGAGVQVMTLRTDHIERL